MPKPTPGTRDALRMPFAMAFSSAILVASVVGMAGDATAGPERLGVGLREALARPLPSEGLRISVVLREPAPSADRAQRQARVLAKQGAVLDRLERGRFTVGRRYRNLSGFSAWADAETIAALNDDPEVLSVDLDRRVYPATAQGGALVGATSVKALGVTGAGIGVAIIDTGIDTDHPQLSASLVAQACFCDNAAGPFGCCPNGFDTQTGAGAAEDHDGHGTQVAGVVASNSVSNEGVAPDASIVALKVFGATGGGSFSDVADALDWVISNHATNDIKVVNLSLSDGNEYDNAAASPCTGTNTANAIAQLENTHGISVFVASGNDGFDAGISFPACVPQAFSVGGVYDQAFGSVNWGICSDTSVGADDFVCHSNSGSLLDLVAPDFRTRVPTLGGGIADVGGTSIASPYAAAMAALLLDADATLSPDQILSWLETGAPLVVNPDNAMSFPRARVDIAVPLLLAVCGNGALEAGEDCDDGNTTGGDCCDASCAFETLGSACDDADLCTTLDSCDGAGLCVGTSPLVCDDANACTDDGCIPATGCSFAPNSDPCDDGNACTDGDVCAGGNCTSGAPAVCDDANACTDDGCVPASGCSFVPNSDPCDDANACTNGDVCSGGVCVPGPPLVCDDANLCTDDSCIPASGCAFAANVAPCDDADACTEGDLCASGSCFPGDAVDCDDFDPCTADGCDEFSGCFHDPIVGCGVAPPVPSVSPPGLVTIALCLLGAGLWRGRIRRAKPIGPSTRSH